MGANIIAKETHLAVLAHIAAHGHQMIITDDLNTKLDESTLANSLWYLQGHGLIHCGKPPISSRVGLPAWVKITSKGMDRVSEDGGLAETINPVVVRFHPESLESFRQILIQALRESHHSPAVKQRVLEELKNQPAQLLSRVLTLGIERVVQLLPL